MPYLRFGRAVFRGEIIIVRCVGSGTGFRCARRKLISRYGFAATCHIDVGDECQDVDSCAAYSAKQVGVGCSTTHPECVHERGAARSTRFSNMFRKIWCSTAVLLGGIRRCSSCCRCSFFAFCSNTTRDVMRVQVVVVLVTLECLIEGFVWRWMFVRRTWLGVVCETQCRLRAARVVFPCLSACFVLLLYTLCVKPRMSVNV